MISESLLPNSLLKIDHSFNNKRTEWSDLLLLFFFFEKYFTLHDQYFKRKLK